MGPSSSRPTHRPQACSGCQRQVVSPRCSRSQTASAARAITYWPEFLPDGSAVLFTIIPANGALENAQIAVLDLRTGRSKVLINGGSHAHYVSTGHLVYGVTGTLRAVAFDLGRLEVAGTAAPVLEGVVTTASGAADISVAANGSLVYVRGRAGSGGQQSIVSVDRQGRVSPLPGLPPDSYRDVRISRDGARLAVATLGDVWTYDFVRQTRSRLTTDPAPDTRPLWTPDGQRIVFTSRRAGYPELFWRAADGTGRDERILARAQNLIDLRANDWSADGGRLLFSELPPSQRGAIGQIAIGRASDPERAPDLRRLLVSDTRPSLQTDAGLLMSPPCPRNRRSTSSDTRSSATGNRFRPLAVASPLVPRRLGTVLQHEQWADARRPGAVGNNARLRASAGIVRVPDVHYGRVSAVRHRP